MGSEELKPGIVFKLLQVFFAILAFFAPLYIGLLLYYRIFLHTKLEGDDIIIQMLIGFVLSVGMLKRKRWAWILNIIEGFIGLGFGLLGYFKLPSDASFVPILFSLILTALIYSQRRFYTRP